MTTSHFDRFPVGRRVAVVEGTRRIAGVVADCKPNGISVATTCGRTIHIHISVITKYVRVAR